MKQGQGRIATAPKAPRNDKQIKVVEYVHTAQGVVPVAELGAEQREQLRRWILCTWLNGLYVGKAMAYYPEGTEDTSSVACGDTFPSRGRLEDRETEMASNARRYGPEGETDVASNARRYGQEGGGAGDG